MLAPYSKPLANRTEAWTKAIDLLIKEGYYIVQDPFTEEHVFCNLLEEEDSTFILDSFIVTSLLLEVNRNTKASFDSVIESMQLYLELIKF